MAVQNLCLGRSRIFASRPSQVLFKVAMQVPRSQIVLLLFTITWGRTVLCFALMFYLFPLSLDSVRSARCRIMTFPRLCSRFPWSALRRLPLHILARIPASLCPCSESGHMNIPLCTIKHDHRLSSYWYHASSALADGGTVGR